MTTLTAYQSGTIERMKVYFYNVGQSEFVHFGKQLSANAEVLNNNFANVVVNVARSIYAERFGKESEAVSEQTRYAELCEKASELGLPQDAADAALEYEQERAAALYGETLGAAAPTPAKTQKRTARENNEFLSGQTFTVVFGEDDYETIQFDTPTTGKLAGKIIVRYLSGSDNETDFTGFAFVSNLGDCRPWKSQLENPKTDRRKLAANIVLCAENTLQYSEAYAMVSGRCAKCNHKLTVPASLNRGYGPDCYALLFG